MIERLARALEHLEQLPDNVQEEAAAQLEALIQEAGHDEADATDALRLTAGRRPRTALDLAGAWSEIPWGEMEEELDRIRHASPPASPLEL